MASVSRGREQENHRGPSLPRRKASPYEILKQAILSGELAPGQQLAETALAAWCEVSRTPIREALTRLEQDGLVGRADRGLVVRERSPEEILDIYETRVVLEATAGRMAAERRTDHDVRLLRRAIARCEAVDEGDVATMKDCNHQFHRTVWQAGHNESLLDLLERLSLHLARYPETTLASPGRWTEAMQQHTALVNAIDKRDTAQAYDLAMHHFQRARDIRLALFDDDAL